VNVNADNAGEINFAKDWHFDKLSVKSNDKTAVTIKNSNGVAL